MRLLSGHFFFQLFPYKSTLTITTRPAATTRTPPVNNCNRTHFPDSSNAPAIGFPNRSPIADGINNIPNLTPKSPGSGDNATVRFSDKLDIAPEKKPKTTAKRRRLYILPTPIHVKPRIPDSKMQIAVMLKTPAWSAM
ncbi:hypothetical protein HYFRA_00010301 [Hymenoscyphus fraxineus]|uniref:Uncharacterized protein n=1 Tax=Hymenoscyphus fraxineus TaxID=746836 RepID=A0A9N9KW48_9HELO|nr:hypothetical protein HYFRA_00010301 [Hymenoscyphus fraxineus]